MDDALNQAVLLALRAQFRPEFLNRIDEIVVYRRLGREQIRAIVDIQLGHLAARLGRRDVALEVDEAAKDYIAEQGWDPQFGARPLKRAIQKHLEDKLAERLLAGQFAPGSMARVGRGEAGLSFEEVPAEPAPASPAMESPRASA
jgi:ATP-dependent Clp protease ATP-binding subunit ClpB